MRAASRLLAALVCAAMIWSAPGCSSEPVVTPLAPAPAHSQPPLPPPTATATTHLVVRLANCTGCVVTLFNAPFGKVSGTDYVVASDVMSDGAASFDVPSRITVGMAIGVRNIPGGYRAERGDPFVVFGYGGRPSGAKIGQAAARLERTGSWCWAGTDQRRFVIELTLARYVVPGNAQDRLASVWANPTLEVPINAGNLKVTHLGGIGIEGIPFCEPGL